MLRNAGQIESKKSGHDASVATRPGYRGRHGRADRVSHRPAVTSEVNLPPFLLAVAVDLCGARAGASGHMVDLSAYRLPDEALLHG